MVCGGCNSSHVEEGAMFCGYCGRRTRIRRDSAVGTLIDNTYRIDEKIAAGGFGAIYRATHMPSGAAVALKILHADFAGEPTLASRFMRESMALMRLENPHTVVTYERGEARDGTLYIAMELLRGESLEQRFKNRGPLPWRGVLAIMRAVCGSLAEAHAYGIVHRDLKPANIHLASNSDFVKVLDFGVAKVLPWSGIDDGTELTIAGQAVGTLEYMAPEQLAGAPCDLRVDIYALGVVAYEMITGRRPFYDAHDPPALITALFTQSVPIQSVPPQVDQLLLRCLEREARDRYASVHELVTVIDRVLALRPTPRGGSDQLVAGAATPMRHHVIAPMTTAPYAMLEPQRQPLPELAFAARGSVAFARPLPEPPRAPPPVRSTASLVMLAAGLAIASCVIVVALLL